MGQVHNKGSNPILHENKIISAVAAYKRDPNETIPLSVTHITNSFPTLI